MTRDSRSAGKVLASIADTYGMPNVAPVLSRVSQLETPQRHRARVFPK
jgi:hypothetical protein